MSRLFFSRAAFAFVFAAICILAACSRNAPKIASPENSANDTPIAITVGKSESRDVASTIDATGSLTAQEKSNVSPKTAGRLSNVFVNVGDFVREGQTLAKVDDRDAKIRLESARAAVRQAKAGVLQAEAKLGLLGGGKFTATAVPEVLTARANLEQTNLELKQAEANEKRYRELTESGDVAMITYEQYKTARDTARARANAAQQQLEATINVARQSNQAIVSAQAAVATAQTQVDDAERVLADTVIKAPFSGYVSDRPTSVGEYVSSSSVIATVLRTNPIKAIIQVPEADVPSVRVGAVVTITVDAYKDQNFAGKISAVNPAIDATSRAASVEALIDNPDNQLRQGMFATTRIVREGGTKGIFVPKTAIFHDVSTQSFRVFVIADGVAKLKVVQVGREEGDWQQILSGVDADQPVATSNVGQLYEGAKVSS
ncbi:MAG: efflux RND transporter periplasmic adaptor subunit [Acidobacteria bacterium]|nr:efflux RND transporter periplasmic adaptor subunit [Pyrinomonadaceae bacterium]MCC6451503.1 efflux RND transporter periplasmic adaptor subunit [Acidobacteriota bacterium]